MAGTARKTTWFAIWVSVAVHDGGIWVLTAPDGGAAGLAPFGITPVKIG
jgi:hypothetical protein